MVTLLLYVDLEKGTNYVNKDCPKKNATVITSNDVITVMLLSKAVPGIAGSVATPTPSEVIFGIHINFSDCRALPSALGQGY